MMFEETNNNCASDLDFNRSLHIEKSHTQMDKKINTIKLYNQDHNCILKLHNISKEDFVMYTQDLFDHFDIMHDADDVVSYRGW